MTNTSGYAPVMKPESSTVKPTTQERKVEDERGVIVCVPKNWVLVPPGDPALTRRVKSAGPHWLMQEKRGRRTFSRGIWAEAELVESVKQDLLQERADPVYQKRLDQGRARREKQQGEYATEFESQVRRFLDFHPKLGELELRMAQQVSAHAIPVGSGTVARTKRIPVGERAEAAVIAWMRHQTTAYDQLKIERVRGRRREVRRQLAQRSRELLGRYRLGELPTSTCPLLRALSETT
ncbi:MAG: hypothetical protein ACI835_000652 [Planctomycetota bacterium]|jgi:hypothetical protein